MPSPPKLKLFTAQDADRAATLHRLCFAHDPWPAHAFVTLLASGAEGVIAEAQNGEITGLTLVRVAADEAEILTFGVIPAYRNNGTAQSMLDHTIKLLREKGINSLFLEVAKNNDAAISLYSKVGFAKIGERQGYYVGMDGIIDAITMERQLNI